MYFFFLSYCFCSSVGFGFCMVKFGFTVHCLLYDISFEGEKKNPYIHIKIWICVHMQPSINYPLMVAFRL